MGLYNDNQNVYDTLFEETYLPSEEYQQLDLSLPDERLEKMLIDSLDANIEYWNQKPWNLQDTDIKNVKFLLGEQWEEIKFMADDNNYVDNRLFSSVRAILSYATGQLAKPELTPSKSDEIYLKAARDLEAALYQHSADEKVEMKVRAAVLNLITRKRGYLKLRWNPHVGLNGDIVTEVCAPEDVIIDRTAKYLENPNIIYHRIRCTIDELCSRFPEKEMAIKTAYAIKQSRYTQVSKIVTYFEAWFTYMENNKPKEGVCWFIPEHKLILDKMPNPNWVYLKSDKKEKQANVLSRPPKPFVWFNYMNLGSSFIDETSLVDQARPLQEMLNRRMKQVWENADFVNGRWVASSRAFNQEDAYKIVNKGAKTIALADSDDVTKAFMNVAGSALPSYVENTIYDARNEIDGIMGTPSVFKGAQPDSQDTLGRDMMVKQQAGMLQDDLVRAVQNGMEDYYKIKLQMMRVNYTDDYWFQVKGGDGKYQFIMLNGDAIDSNVKVSVQVDSTLPLDKASVRATAMELWKSGNAIDYRTLMEDLGLPNPEIRTERYLRQQLDPQGFLASVEMSQINADAESDIMLLIADKVPEERDNYDEKYFTYINEFLSGNRYAKLVAEDRDAAKRIVSFVMAVQHVANDSANLKASMLNDAGLIPPPPPMPQPGMPGQPPMEGGAPPAPPEPGVAPEMMGGGMQEQAPPVPTQ